MSDLYNKVQKRLRDQYISIADSAGLTVDKVLFVDEDWGPIILWTNGKYSWVTDYDSLDIETAIECGEIHNLLSREECAALKGEREEAYKARERFNDEQQYLALKKKLGY